MSENPFAEPGDQDRTVIRPMPGGARAATPRPPMPPGPQAAPAPSVGPAEAVLTGAGPLAAAAAPLLQLLARLRHPATPPDPGDMRERTRTELRAFERRAREAGVPADQLRLGHYALCATLDDVVLNTPWGGRGAWHDAPLALALHQDARAGAGFFEQLRAVRAGLPGSLPVLELMFICLSLGMMGSYRAKPDGPAQLDRVRHHVHELIGKSAAPAPTALAPDTVAIDAAFTPRRNGVPVWVGASAALALVAGVYVWGLSSVNAASDSLYRLALASPPAAMPTLVRPPATPPPAPPPAPTAPGPAERLRAALADLPVVQVIDTPAATILRIPAAALFSPTGATPRRGALLERVAKGLAAEPGDIQVIGYTDSRPVRTVAFPSNFALSAARARAVRAALIRWLPRSRHGAERIVAEGRADADPIAPNTTVDGRERNSRMEIVVQRAS